MLKHHAELLAELVYVMLLVVYQSPLKPYFAGCRDLKKVEAAQKRAFSRSGGADYNDLFAFFYRFGDAAENLYLPAFSEILFQILNLYHFCGASFQADLRTPTVQQRLQDKRARPRSAA